MFMSFFITVPAGKTIHLTIVWGKDAPAFERAFDVWDDATNEHIVQANSVNQQAFTPTVNGEAKRDWRALRDSKLRFEPAFKPSAGGDFFHGTIVSQTIHPDSGELETRAIWMVGPFHNNVSLATIKWKID
jgi:hypothetical protein